MKITAYRNRLAVNCSAKDGITEVRNGSAPFCWNRSPVQFEVALFDGDQLLSDLSNLQSITLTIKPSTNTKASQSIASATVQAAEFGELDNDGWKRGEPESCHALFSLTGAQATFDLGNDTSGQFSLIVSASLGENKTIVLGTANLVVEEAGL